MQRPAQVKLQGRRRVPLAPRTLVLLLVLVVAGCGDDRGSGGLAGTSHGVSTGLEEQAERYQAQVAAYDRAIDALDTDRRHASGPDELMRIVSARADLIVRRGFAKNHLERARKYLALGCRTEKEAQAKEAEEERRERVESDAQRKIDDARRAAEVAEVLRSEEERRAKREEALQAEAQAREAALAEEAREALEAARRGFMGTYRADLTYTGKFLPLHFKVPAADVHYLLRADADGGAALLLMANGACVGAARGTWSVSRFVSGVTSFDVELRLTRDSETQGVPPDGEVRLRVDLVAGAPEVSGPLYGVEREATYLKPIPRERFEALSAFRSAPRAPQPIAPAEPSGGTADEWAARLRAAATAGDPQARVHWRRLEALDPSHAALAEVEGLLAKLPFPAGTLIPSDATAQGGLQDHAALPLAGGLRLLMESTSVVGLRVDAAGVRATSEKTPGKSLLTALDKLVGVRWSSAKPEPVRLGDIRAQLGGKGPSLERYEGPVRWLPGDHVAFGREVWRSASAKARGAYRTGSSAWGDAFFGSAASGTPNNLRTRLAPGAGDHSAVAFCTQAEPTRAQVALAWLARTDLDGKLLSSIDVLAQPTQTVPFEFVPWGKANKPLLLLLDPDRVPVLLELTAGGAKEVARGPPVAEGLQVGAPTWADLDRDGLREYVAPTTDAAGAVSILVLLTEKEAASR